MSPKLTGFVTSPTLYIQGYGYIALSGGLKSNYLVASDIVSVSVAGSLPQSLTTKP